mgnify:CR=1 FL=1
MFGGFDGLNTLDQEQTLMSDQSTSFDAKGGASTGYIPTGFATTQAGEGISNSNVMSFRYAIDIAVDPTAVDANVLTIPGIREPYIMLHKNQKPMLRYFMLWTFHNMHLMQQDYIAIQH